MKTFQNLTALTLVSLSLTACFEENANTNTTETPTKTTAVSVGATADYTSASFATIATESPFTATTALGADSNTDVTLSSYGTHIYRIARYGANFISKYDISDLSKPVWQCSTEGGDTNSNPYQVIQISESKAYVLRYGTGKIWVINPSITDSAKCSTDFKTGEIDLSSFDSDGVPDMVSGVVVNGKLFVAMQRLQSFKPTQTAQLAVIDSTTNALIDVDSVTAGTQAINLIGRNPGHISYQADLNKIYVQSVGQYASSSSNTAVGYSGGVDAIDPSSYAVSQKVDDSADTLQISGMALVSATQGYLVGYADYKNNTLYQFNPTDGSISKETNGQITAIAGITAENISGIFYDSNSKLLWISTTSGFKLLNTTDNSVTESLIDTKMNPSSVVFISQAVE